MKRILLGLGIIIGIIIIIIFNTKEFSNSKNEKILIVSTTTMLTDLVKEIGGEKVEVEGLMGAGVDPHLYNATSGDVKKIQNADIIVYNGIHLEGKMTEIFEQLSDKKILCAGNYIPKEKLLLTKDEENVYDPHIWFDINLWKEVAQGIANDLSEIDKKNETYYQNNFTHYAEELNNLEEYIEARISEIPKEQRYLITAHDAFSYFGKSYNFVVKGLQGISTNSEAGTLDVSELANYIYTNKIKAIFVESSVPSRTIEALQAAVEAKGFNVNIGGELYSDSLGDLQSGHETYIKTFKANVDTIVDNLQ